MPGATVRELTPDEVAFSVDARQFGFQTTDELTSLEEIVGQPRAQRALDLGIAVKHSNYHIYVAGMTGTGRLQMVQGLLAQRVRDETIPPDWIYLNNFDDPDRPLAVSLPAGEGIRFKKDMETLIDTLADALPKAFRQEDFDREKDRIRKEYRTRGEKIFAELDALARANGMTAEQLPDGQILFIPLKDGRPMSPEEVQQLTAEELAQLEQHQQELIDKASRVLTQQHDMERQLTLDVREVARAFASRLIGPMVDALSERYDSAPIRAWLVQVREHMVDHLERFRERSLAPSPLAMVLGESAAAHDRFLEYQVNLLIDNSSYLDSKHPAAAKTPIVIEDAPNYRNLFGTIERTAERGGKVVTDFTHIRAGSLLKASGGYLILNLMDALVEPFVWKELKRTLKNGLLQIEPYDPFAMFSVTAMKPQPIPLSTKIVAVGEPLIYHLLYLYDEDFREIFRVKADFDDEIVRDEQAGTLYGRFVRRLGQTEKLVPFSADGVAELVKAGARLAGNRNKLSTAFPHLANVVREADFWARSDNAPRAEARHVESALQEHVYRSDLIAEKIRELIAEGTLLIDVIGRRTGQVNGLAVADLGDYAFGRPTRMTASVGVGAAGIINIERESQLSGRTFDKGLFILEGYLRNMYAQEQPLSLSAGIAMEQSYGGIDGDSASVAELLCLLSALADAPLRQDVAVTGSVNQWGDVQAIGGVNEKIEGFFDVCRELEFTGTQGVCIPQANVPHLVLRRDVLEAIGEGSFHLWAVSSVDEAIELFTGIPVGSVDRDGTLHYRVMTRLQEMSQALQAQHGTGPSRIIWTPGMPPPAVPPDPRPPLPGQGER